MPIKPKLKILLITLGVVVTIVLIGFARLIVLHNNRTYYDELDEALDNADNAEVLVMRNRKMKTLPAAISKLIHLKVLNLGNNELTELPMEIGDLKSLEELNAEHNLLTALPKEVMQLSRLRKINLSHNKIGSFPLVMPFTVNEVYLSGNEISIFPEQMKFMLNLHVLDLAENHIKEISDHIELPDSLTNIDLFGNQLQNVSPKMFSLPGLKELILEDNPLDEKTEGLYKNFKQR